MFYSILLSNLGLWIGTLLGSIVAFLLPNKVPRRIQRILYGFIGGWIGSTVFWSMIYWKFIKRVKFEGMTFLVSLLACLFIGFFLLPTLSTMYRLCFDSKIGKRTDVQKSTTFLIAVASYFLARGVAVGISFKSVALPIATSMMFQNVLFGVFIATLLRISGFSDVRSFLLSTFTGFATPIASPVILIWHGVKSPLPFFVFFAGGLMLYFIFEVAISRKAWGDFFSIWGLFAAYFSGILGIITVPDPWFGVA